MDSLLVATTPPPLLLRQALHQMARHLVATRPSSRPLIAATLSKPPEAACSSSPTTVVVEDIQLVAPPRIGASVRFPTGIHQCGSPSGYISVVPHRSRSNSGGDGMMNALIYLTNILTLKVYDVAIESPLQLAPKLSGKLGIKVWLKREDLQPVFSFKIRGAYNMMAKLPRELLEKGVICSSAGNHAQGVAFSTKRLNYSAVIVMPITAPEIKWKSVEALGAKVVLVGDSYDEAQAYAKKKVVEEGRTFMPPF